MTIGSQLCDIHLDKVCLLERVQKNEIVEFMKELILINI
jgi:hypothetical protein